MTTVAHKLNVQPAAVADVAAIHELVNGFARQGEMLPRTMTEIYENLLDYSVIREGARVLACGALHIMWDDLAEIRSLAVRDGHQGQGLGAHLVRAHLDEARRLGLTTVFALTYRPGFFERMGFRQADVMALPRKVWNECYRCPNFPNCHETAVNTDVTAAP